MKSKSDAGAIKLLHTHIALRLTDLDKQVLPLHDECIYYHLVSLNLMPHVLQPVMLRLYEPCAIRLLDSRREVGSKKQSGTAAADSTVVHSERHGRH